MKIGVIGLHTNENIGDYLLFECAKSLITQHHSNAQIVDIDADPKNVSLYLGKRKINLRIYRILTKHRDSWFFQRPVLGYYLSYFRWWIKNNWYYRQKIKNLDCIVLSGGGFIKFKTQGLNYIDEQIIKLAKRYKIPIMLNAVGIEGYDEKDYRCQRLKRTLNYDVVKTITTRDDLKTLQEKYISNPSIKTALVGDTVFWLQECFTIRKQLDADTIGINLIRPENYKFYGGKANRLTVEKFYKDLINELKRRNAKFSLFSNGMKADHKFGMELIKAANLPKETLLKRPLHSEEFLNQMSGFNVILAGRMHAGITAYAMEIPRVGLIWSDKISFFSKLIGERQSYFDENELDAVKVANLLCNPDTLKFKRSKTKKLKQDTLTYLNEFLQDVGEASS